MNGDLDTSSVKSDEERLGVHVKMENFDFLEKGAMNLNYGSEIDEKSYASSSSRTERRRLLVDGVGNRTKMKSKPENGQEFRKIDELNPVEMEKEFKDLKLQMDTGNALEVLKNPERRIKERIKIEEYQSDQGVDNVRRRYLASNYFEGGQIEEYRSDQGVDNLHRRSPASNYFEGGSSTYYSESSYGYGELLGDRSEGSGYGKVDHAGGDRAELLRKLDDLTYRLRQSGELADKNKEKGPQRNRIAHRDPYNRSEDWFSDSSSGMDRPYMQFPDPVQHDPGRSNMNHAAYMNMHELGDQRFYPPAHARNHFQGVRDPLRHQMAGRSPNQASAPFQRRDSHGYSSGHYLNKDMMIPTDQSEIYPAIANNHLPSCTCYHCYDKIQVPQFYGHIGSGSKRLPDVQIGSSSYNHKNFSPSGPPDFYPGVTNMPPFKSHSVQSHSRWPSDISSEVDSFVRRPPTRMQQSDGWQHCRPMSGGAPFLTCYNCFELLLVPKKVLIRYRNPKKLRCGACSTIIVVRVSNKRIPLSVHKAAKGSSGMAKNNHLMILNDGDSNTQGQEYRAGLTISSEDYDHSAHDFQSRDRELVSHSADHPGLATAEMESVPPKSSSTYKDEDSLNNFVASEENSDYAERPVKGKSPPPASSSLHNNNLGGICSESENTTTRSKHEQVMTKISTPQQSSMKDEATEIELPSNEDGNTGTSLDSEEASRRENQLMPNKEAKSFFAGISGGSFRHSNKSNQKVDQEIANVTVNGHLIPDRLVKKAEKLAGSIQPGNYWYDYRAGFWGVIGGPCLGIIPPFIAEFNYPLPENCANGNTNVFVNGRELHHKDLNLLASRGLPSERHRAYVVEISGRVLDEYTGEELESLGQLAPTVERMKRGFGMRVPKAVA